MRIAMVGTRGVPARYGGFETAVEEVGRRLVAAGHDVIVYCRRRRATPQQPDELPRHAAGAPARRAAKRSLETLSHTALSVAAPATGTAASTRRSSSTRPTPPFLPLLRAARHPGRHARRRPGVAARPSGAASGRRYYRVAEALAVRWSDALIADARGIADYYADEFGARDRAASPTAPRSQAAPAPSGSAELGLEPGEYHLVVARFEPENHVDVDRRRATCAAARRAARWSSSARRRTPTAYTARASQAGRPTRGSGCSAGSGTRSSSTSSTPTR